MDMPADDTVETAPAGISGDSHAERGDMGADGLERFLEGRPGHHLPEAGTSRGFASAQAEKAG